MALENINYQSESKSRVTSIFKESPLFLALIDSIVTPYVNQQEDFIKFSDNLLNIDFAERSQLDFIGRIVGQSRVLVSFNTEPYFGFEGSYQSDTFGTISDPSVGGFWNSYDNYNASTSRLLTDEEYRRLIRARIIKNNSKCTTDDLISVINLLANNNTCSISVVKHGVISVSVDDQIGFVAYFLDRIGLQDDIIPLPVGVRIGQADWGGGEDPEPPVEDIMDLEIYTDPSHAESPEMNQKMIISGLDLVDGSFDPMIQYDVDFGLGDGWQSFTGTLEHTFDAPINIYRVKIRSSVLHVQFRVTCNHITKINTFGKLGTNTQFHNIRANFTVPNSLPAHITNMSAMWLGCLGLCSNFASAFSQWNTSLVTNMASCFNNTNFVTTGGIENWNTSKVETMSAMFQGARFDALSLNNWDFTRVKNMGLMFSRTGRSDSYTGLELLDVDWNIPLVENTSFMFQGADQWNVPVKFTGADFNSINCNSMLNLCQSLSQNIQSWCPSTYPTNFAKNCPILCNPAYHNFSDIPTGQKPAWCS